MHLQVHGPTSMTLSGSHTLCVSLIVICTITAYSLYYIFISFLCLFHSTFSLSASLEGRADLVTDYNVVPPYLIVTVTIHALFLSQPVYV